MNSEKFDLSPFINTSDKEDSFDLHQTLSKFFYHWRLFLLGLLITMAGAFIYLQFAQPKYEIKATLLIQDETKTRDEKSTLQEIEIARTPKLVENEVEVLKSRYLILQVVNELQLWTVYQESVGYKKQDLYKKSPVRFTLLESTGDLKGQEIELLIKNGETFFLKNAKGELKEHAFKERFKSDFGIWKLEPGIDFNSHAGAAITIILHDPEIVADDYQQKIEVTLLNKGAPAVSLLLIDEVEQRGKDILNTLIASYNEASILEKSRITESTLSFIDHRLASLSKELNTAEGQVEGFRSSRGLTDISSQSQVYLENVQVNDHLLNEVNVKLNVIEGIENYVNSSENAETLPSVLGISDPGLSKLIDQLSQLQLQRAELLATTPEDNPIFNPLNRQINSTRTAIKENIGNIKSSLLNTKRELESFNSKFETSIRNIPGQERELIGIKRQQTIKENLYIYLLQKREELSLSYAATLTDARMVDSAYAGPVQEPKRLLILGIAFVLGLVLPAGYIFAKDSFNSRITNRKEIEDAVQTPVIMEVNFEKTIDPIVVLDKNKNAVSEHFRMLRTNLHFLHGKRKTGRVTLITSSISEEGKSFIASNLAVTLAASGRKTLILELDLRKPKISIIFKLPTEHQGISNYLAKEASIKEIIQASSIYAKLDIIGCGSIPSNPSELLEQAEMDTLIDYLRTEYDDIILETPPVKLVTDALIISRLSDVTLYVIRQGHTHKSLMPFIDNLYQKQYFSQMNIIFNGIQTGRYGYGNDYGNGYYEQRKKEGFPFSKIS